MKWQRCSIYTYKMLTISILACDKIKKSGTDLKSMPLSGKAGKSAVISPDGNVPEV